MRNVCVRVYAQLSVHALQYYYVARAVWRVEVGAAGCCGGRVVTVTKAAAAAAAAAETARSIIIIINMIVIAPRPGRHVFGDGSL